MPITAAVRGNVSSVLNDPGTHAATLLVLLADLFGTVEFVNWEPETVRIELEEIVGIKYQKLPQLVRDRIDAVCAAVSTNSVYVSLESFINVTNAFAGGGVDFRIFDPATIEEAACTVMEMELIDGDKPSEELYSQEIRHYLGVRAEYEGMLRQPDMLKWAVKPKKSADASSLASAPDPDVFAASWRSGNERVTAINAKVKLRRSEILQQIAELPLGRRDTESWNQFYGKAESR